MTDQPISDQIKNDLDVAFAAAELTRLLREAFIAGVKSTRQGWNGEQPESIESLIEFEGEAAEYASEIVGKLG
ncbi:hypothetical protein [Phaeobacter italicus]|uniref:hypothetical protein n=1 Tax=Phaeobacter italicus TaxID=481446 RepID=UPI0023311C49|nr:hypothetical protein [Phaeobacter italicus]